VTLRASTDDVDGVPDRAARVLAACGHKRGNGCPLQRHQVQPPHTPYYFPRSCTSPQTTSAGRVPSPRSRCPAHPHYAPRPDEPAECSDEGPHFGEGGSAVDGPARSSHAGGEGGGEVHGASWFVEKNQYLSLLTISIIGRPKI
jgi:hypothetical protein